MNRADRREIEWQQVLWGAGVVLKARSETGSRGAGGGSTNFSRCPADFDGALPHAIRVSADKMRTTENRRRRSGLLARERVSLFSLNGDEVLEVPGERGVSRGTVARGKC